MKLSQILNDIEIEESYEDRLIDNISNDSRKAAENTLFVAVTGFQSDGHRYLQQAKDNGAIAALVEHINPSIDIKQIRVDNTRKALATVATKFFDHPTNAFNLVGITGTNGKTTTSYMLESIFSAAGHKTGMVGTIESRIDGKSFSLSHTTPEAVDLQKFFAQMKEDKVQTAVMEVSSHACLLNRIDGSSFDQVIFTNLTQDHLDFHKSLDQYFKAKKRLFEINEEALHIINIDDDFGSKLASNNNVKTYGLKKNADFRASDIELGDFGSRFSAHFEGHSYEFEIMMPGLFNIYNALAAITSATNLGIKPEIIQHGFFNLNKVPGRFETLRLDAPFKVIVDYAHTPDGLKSSLSAAKQITKGKLITVFGCGGERDKGKRPMMGRIAAKLSDEVIVTSDNPRGEDPETIIKQITENRNYFETKIDRKEAIYAALRKAKKDDTVMIAGKGHEMTQEIGSQHVPFNDREVVWEFFK